MSTGISSIVLTLPYKQAFNMFGESLAECIGASALLYAAIAYFVFDDSYYMDDIIENNPDIEDQLRWWLDDIQSSFFEIITNLRRYYETDYEAARHISPSSPKRAYELIAVRYREADEDLFIAATRDPRDHHVGNQWRVLAESV